MNVMKVEDLGATWPGKAAYHDSCQVYRALGIHREPRALLARVRGLELVEMQQADVCCGFGGTFSLQFPTISEAIVADKVAHVLETGAEYLISAEISCLMNIGGYWKSKSTPCEPSTSRKSSPKRRSDHGDPQSRVQGKGRESGVRRTAPAQPGPPRCTVQAGKGPGLRRAGGPRRAPRAGPRDEGALHGPPSPAPGSPGGPRPRGRGRGPLGAHRPSGPGDHLRSRAAAWGPNAGQG